MAATKKGGEKKGCSAITERNPEICHEGDGNPRCAHGTRLNKAVWAKGIRNVAYNLLCVQLSRKHNDEDSPNKLRRLVTYVLVPTFKKLQTVTVDQTELAADCRIKL
ncbi:60S ribosomal protein L31-like [Rhinolophus ferrumequinum]|uniref:60S ribosomal protein L31-like n=1 Tax=Rhinolophus ferrumequinum TaxID=59479 RepID=UPI00140FD129|nr:60S ribosomal protein L31-like [Rhinolophus ferrumequinum]